MVITLSRVELKAQLFAEFLRILLEREPSSRPDPLPHRTRRPMAIRHRLVGRTSRPSRLAAQRGKGNQMWHRSDSAPAAASRGEISFASMD